MVPACGESRKRFASGGFAASSARIRRETLDEEDCVLAYRVVVAITIKSIGRGAPIYIPSPTPARNSVGMKERIEGEVGFQADGKAIKITKNKFFF